MCVREGNVNRKSEKKGVEENRQIEAEGRKRRKEEAKGRNPPKRERQDETARSCVDWPRVS